MPTAVLKTFGPPGTGKTTTAMGIIEAEIKAGTPAGWIGFASFTKAAVQEAKNRVASQFGISEEEMTWMRTIHSTAYRLLGLTPDRVLQRSDLKAFGSDSGYEFSDQAPDEEDLSEQAGTLQIGDWALAIWDWCRNYCPADPLSVLASYPGDLDHPQVTGRVFHVIQEFAADYSAYKDHARKVDFVDFLSETFRRKLRPSIAVLLVDEAQDLSPLQWDIIRLWAERCERLYLLGDDDQAIFTFQGGEPELLLNYPGDEVILDQSYRLPSAVHRVADFLIRQNTRRRTKAFHPYSEGGAVDLIDRSVIHRLPLHEGSWYILARNKQFLNRPPQRRQGLPGGYIYDLIDRGIPFRNLRGPDPLKPDDKLRAASLIGRLSDGEPITLTELHRLIDHVPSRTGSDVYVEHGSKKRIHEARQVDGDQLVARQDLPALGFTDTFMAALDRNPLAPLIISDFRKRALATLLEAHGADVLSRTPRITLSTIHGVKGGEADNVVVDLSMGGRTWQAFQSGQAEEERRVFYVGITRARRNLYVVPSADGKEFPLTLNVPGMVHA